MAAPSRRVPSALRDFLTSESAGGIVLMATAAAGLIIANSPAADTYFYAQKTYVGPLSVLHWINDGLMAVFFLLVGLEIKREFLDGQLSTWPRRMLPGFAALGGMAAPALIYLGFTWGDPETMKGWAIPAATDIAFTLGVMALLGKRIPVALKIFVTALAIIDDLGAVLIIALFYTANLALPWIAAAFLVLAAMFALNWMKVSRLLPYIVLAVILWFCVLQSGVHATLAGVAAALAIPLRQSKAAPDDPHSPLHRLEHAIQPWVAFAIVPIFGFANAGVSLSGLTLDALFAPVTLGIILGLFVGKQLGIFAFSWATIKSGLADYPEDASVLQLYGASLLCGIGFTMSLFIGLLAFPTSELLQAEVKIGVLVGSLLSALAGAAVLLVARRDVEGRPSHGAGAP